MTTKSLNIIGDDGAGKKPLSGCLIHKCGLQLPRLKELERSGVSQFREIILFIKDNDHRVFLEEVWDKFVDTEGCFSDYPGPSIWGLNGSELLLCPENPESIIDDQPSVEKVYIFASPDIEKARSSRSGLQERRISVKQDNGRSWVCSEDGKTWSWGLGDKVGTDQVNDLVQGCTVDMSDLYVSKWGTEFSIRIVEAVCS